MRIESLSICTPFHYRYMMTRMQAANRSAAVIRFYVFLLLIAWQIRYGITQLKQFSILA